jgi:hypothetical protein
MGDAKATRLTLDDELICLADDRAAISAALRLRGESFGFGTKCFRRNRLRLA